MNKWFKQVMVAGTIAVTSMSLLPNTTHAAMSSIQVQINDALVSFTGVGPFVDDQGFTQVPIRMVAEDLGAEVHFEKSQELTKVTIVKGNWKAVLHAGSSYAQIGSDKVKMDTMMRIVNGVTYVPVRFVSEAFGHEVSWNAANQIAMINTDGGSYKPAYIAPEPEASKGAEVISVAKQYSGTKYVWGGTSPSGFDCSGFVQYVFAKQGISLPHSSLGMHKNVGTPVAKSDLQPGDLVFFITNKVSTSHVGIYIGNNQFISAASSGVKVDSLGSSYWGPKYNGANRIL
ncbi:NlpC/P60 family protein [Paenibacillus sp. JSM ZJ436]|uniref:C40 family peptidase n=1 Tax=Paenibacillus sp. JSM ZJ436 TaxID=3376190 RepID=UPI0037B280ED